MKQIYLLLLSFLFTSLSFAQIPATYYNSANGLTGYTLKTELKNIITSGHSDQGYGGLWIAYQTTDRDTYYENDNTVLDIYSENPTGTDPYNFTIATDQCGTYSVEGDCYNREHIVPQSTFSSASPMRNDVHHVYPTDGKTNGLRSSFAFGTVATATSTSQNGSKLGNSSVSGYSGTVFEPLDEFKGDIARAMLYFATRYEQSVNGYPFDMFDGSNNKVFTTWALDMLLDWHNNVDPVDQRDIDRNNAAYNFQGNANPFISHPEYANAIWSPGPPDTQAPTVPTNLVASNPSSNTVDLSWTASTDNVAVQSYNVYVDGLFYQNTGSNNTTYTVTGLASETPYVFTILARDTSGNQSGLSTSASSTTLAGGGTGTECANENFENIPANSGSYSERIWTGVDGINNGWTASDARTDQTLDTRAICIRNGILTSPTLNGGIGSLTVTTQLTFSGTAGTFDLMVNGSSVGSIPYSSDNTVPTTTTINNININGNITIVLDNLSTTNRVRIDNLSWTCFSTLGTTNFDLNEFKIYPNPVKGNLLTIENTQNTNFEIYDLLGKKILKGTITPNNNKVSLSTLNKGVYILRLQNKSGGTTKKLIKE